MKAMIEIRYAEYDKDNHEREAQYAEILETARILYRHYNFQVAWQMWKPETRGE